MWRSLAHSIIQDGIYPDTAPGGFKGESTSTRMENMHSNSGFKVPSHVELLHPPLLYLSHMARTSQQLRPLSLTDSAQNMLRCSVSFYFTINQRGCAYDVYHSSACWAPPFSTAVVMMVLLVEVESASTPDVRELFSSLNVFSIFPAADQPASGGKVFNPGFPVTCPFVTAVGATQVNPGNPVTAPEGACEQVIFSGGGFSNIFP